MQLHLRRAFHTGTDNPGHASWWDIMGPALLAIAFALSTAMIFFL
ncbi:hypothetical protein [Komagataeibacter xylinus]|nr:hypothetical protein [Komagataeibacter xylinus]GBQ70234.1 hypothetical protein AA15237_0822 [Komagataeibacter xylinus NBRC 15237]